MEQRKINELKRRNARVVIKAGIPFKVFYDEDLNNDQMSEMMDWCEEADREGLLPIEVEQMTEEEKIYHDTWQSAFDAYFATHQEEVAAVRNAKNGAEGLSLISQSYDHAAAYADAECKRKGLK